MPGTGAVGLIFSKKFEQKLMGFVQYDGRLIIVKINPKPKETVMSQVYMPNTKDSSEAVEKVFSELDRATSGIKSDVNLIVMKVWNSVP